jgi:hypothetical protein
VKAFKPQLINNVITLFSIAFKSVGLVFLFYPRGFLRKLARNLASFFGIVMMLFLPRPKSLGLTFVFQKKKGVGLKDVEIWNLSSIMRHILGYLCSIRIHLGGLGSWALAEREELPKSKHP